MQLVTSKQIRNSNFSLSHIFTFDSWWLHVIIMFLATSIRHFSCFYYVFRIKMRSCIETRLLESQEKKEKRKKLTVSCALYPLTNFFVCKTN
jgi:hypothetical protein